MNESDRTEHGASILLVIVLYKIKLEQSATYLSLIKSLNDLEPGMDVLVYDNSPVAVEEPLTNMGKLNINYIADPANSGVSKAYNTAAEYALKKNKKWMLILDQDTVFPEHALSVYLDTFKKYPESRLFVPVMTANNGKIVSPCYFRFMRGFSAGHVNMGVNSLNKFSVINCGMCVDVGAFIKNSGYNERIRLDFSDHDFVRRFKKSNGDKFIVIDLKVSHQLSSETRNDPQGDLSRFDCYLEGAKRLPATTAEKLLLSINALVSAMKLSLSHRDSAFLKKWFKWIGAK